MYSFLEQCPTLTDPKNGKINETVENNQFGILYSIEYFCENGYRLIGESKRICNPNAPTYIDKKVVGRKQYSGESPVCKGTKHNWINDGK